MDKQDKVVSDVPQVTSSREGLEQHVRARAWKDDAFRQEFQADPKGVLQRDYAQWFPEGKVPLEFSIKVIEEEEQSLCFVLPPKTREYLPEADEIDDGELLSISGAFFSEKCSQATCIAEWTKGCACQVKGLKEMRGSRL